MKRIDYTPALYQTPNHADPGPAMKELNARQQAVIYYMIDTGADNWTEACKEAGYSQDGSYDALRVQASRMKRDPRIAAALVEEGKRRVNFDLPTALKTIRTIAGDIAHKDALKAATTLAAMSGVSAVTVSKTEHTHIHTGDLMERARAAAERLGIRLEDIGAGVSQPRMKDVTPVLANASPDLDISDCR